MANSPASVQAWRHHHRAGAFVRLILPCAALCTLLPGTWPFAAQAQPPVQTSDLPLVIFDIQPQPLDAALGYFSRQTKVMIAANPELTHGVGSPGLHGSYTVAHGLRQLLQGTGLDAVGEAGGGYRLQRLARTDVATLAAVQVVGRRPDPVQEIYRSTGSVNVVTREQIERLPPRNSSDLLADIPGVSTSSSRQNPGLAVNIRGMQGYGRVNVMIDGARQNFQQSGHGNNGSAYLDPALLAQVDISKGPSAGLGGAGMIAGQINFRTLDVNDLVRSGTDYGGHVDLTHGSNNYHFAGSAAVGWRLDERWELAAAVSKKNVGDFSRGSRNANQNETVQRLDGQGASRLTSQDTRSGLVKLGFRPNASHQFKLGYVGYQAKFNEGGKTPGGVVVESHNAVRSDTITLAHKWEPDSPWWRMDSSLYYTNTRNDSARDALYGSSSVTSLIYEPSEIHYETYTIGATAQNQANFALGALDAQWTVGGEFYLDRTRPGAIVQTLGVYREDPEIAVGGTPAGERRVWSTFTEFGLSWRERVDLTAGLRYDRYALKGDGLIYVGRFYNGAGARPVYSDMYTSFSTGKHDAALLPSLRLAIKPLESLQFFASYGKGMRPPAITESLRFGKHPGVTFYYYPNPNLEAEKSRSWEIGANLVLDRLLTQEDQLGLKLAWFNTKVDDYIVGAAIMAPTSTTSDGTTPPYSFVNLLAPFRTRGLELSGDYDAGIAFASVNYTHSLIDTGSARYDPFPLGSTVGYPPTSYGQGDGSPNIMYAMPPQKKLVLSGGVRLFDKRLTLGLRMHYEKPANNASGSITSWTGGTDYQRSYHLYDAWASLAISENLTFRLAVQNLRNENYYEIQDGVYWVGPGRTSMGTLSIRF